MHSFGQIALVVTLLIAADSGGNAEKHDLEKFQGTWSLISAERDGKKTPEEDAKKIKLTIQGNQFVLRKDGVVVSEGTMTLDASKKPKEVNEAITAGPNKGKMFLAIYEIADDQHRICFAPAGKERPTTFPPVTASFSRSGGGTRNEHSHFPG